MSKIVKLLIPNSRGYIYKPMIKKVDISSLRYSPEIKAKDNTFSAICNFFNIDMSKLSDENLKLAKELAQELNNTKKGFKLKVNG